MSASASATKQPKKLHRILKVALWVLATLLVLIALLAAWMWSKRYDLIERQAITYLETLDIQAELNIQSANRTSADIRNIRLSHGTQTFLSVNRLQAAYQWRDLLNGRVDRLEFTGLKAVITVNEQGQIIDGWRPPAGNDAGNGVPKDGIQITDGEITLQTPYGDIPFQGDIDVTSLDEFQVQGEIVPARLLRKNLTATLAGPVKVTRNGTSLAAEGQLKQVSLYHPSGTIHHSTLNVSGYYDLGEKTARGELSVDGGEFASGSGPAGQIETLDLEGHWDGSIFTGEVTADIRDLRIQDEDRRQTLARIFSLAKALEDVPIAQNFAPSLFAPLDELLNGARARAHLAINVAPDSYQLSLIDPLTLTAETTEMRVYGHPETPIYAHQINSDSFQIAADVELNQPIPLKLSDLAVSVKTNNGFDVAGINQTQGTLQTRRIWTGRTQDGQAARLRPLSVAFDYTASPEADRQIILRGAAHYDGDIPGGYVEGLKAGGVLTTRLREQGPVINFAANRALTFDQLDTPSDWTIKDFLGHIRPGSPLYSSQRGQSATVKSSLKDATFIALREATAAAEEAQLDIALREVDLTGTILSDQQDWTGQFTDFDLKSETFPVLGTDLSVPSGDFTVALSPDAPSAFTFETPRGSLRTPSYTVRNMTLRAEGTSESYHLDYEGGLVSLVPQPESTMAFPTVPMIGSLTYANGAFSGQAETNLPRAQETPIAIDYRFGSQGGEADISIQALQFRPGRLQPQDLAPAFRGKIAEVNGMIDADFNIRFGTDTPLEGSGTLTIYDTSLGTAPGPVSGLRGTVELTSLFPVITAPDQRLYIRSFNPGFPLENGELIYALVPEGVSVASALFPLGEGQVSFDPFTWRYRTDANRATLRVADVEVGEFLKNFGDGRLAVTGRLEGTIPVVVRGIDVRVEKGRLEVPTGGNIKYTPKEIPDALAQSAANTALQALENFDYQSLFVEIDGPLDGDMLLGLDFGGSNPDVLYGVPFEFGVTVEGELFNIAQSLNPNALQQQAISTVVSQSQRE